MVPVIHLLLLLTTASEFAMSQLGGADEEPLDPDAERGVHEGNHETELAAESWSATPLIRTPEGVTHTQLLDLGTTTITYAPSPSSPSPLVSIKSSMPGISRTISTLDPRTLSTLDSRTIATEDPLTILIEDPRTILTQDSRTILIEDPRTIIAEDPRTISTQDPRTISSTGVPHTIATPSVAVVLTGVPLSFPALGRESGSSETLWSDATTSAAPPDDRPPTRGDLPPHLDSEETTRYTSGLLFSPPLDTFFTLIDDSSVDRSSSDQPLTDQPNSDYYLSSDESLTDPSPADHSLTDQPPSDYSSSDQSLIDQSQTDQSSSDYLSSDQLITDQLLTDPSPADRLLSDQPPGSETSTTERTPTPTSPSREREADGDEDTRAEDVTVDPRLTSEGTTVTGLDLLTEGSHTEAVTETTSTQSVTTGVLTTYSSFLDLHDSWVWFLIGLRGNCPLVDFTNSYILFSDFITSVSSLLLYNKEHIVINTLSCSSNKMMVNMSIDPISYPNCEGDIRTLLSHKNLRLDLHNASFYIESYETKRTLIFETKPDVHEDGYKILYLTLGGVGVSLVCIVFAGIFFAIYQCTGTRNGKFNIEAADKFLPESPRSLRPKMEMDHTLRLADTHTYTVNMYKSYSDLSSQDLYGSSSSPDFLESARESSTKASTNTMKPKKKKKSGNGGLGNLETHHQELWSESLTQTNEEFMAIRSVNTLASSFRGNENDPDKESLNPLLMNGRANQELGTTTKAPAEDNPIPLICPSTPAIPKGVLQRMDDLITNTLSNSSPNITTGVNTAKPAHSALEGAYTAAAYSNTTINMSSSTIFTTTTAAATTTTTTTTASSTERKAAAPPTTTASAENLCLTRITFMEMCIWPQHSATLPDLPLFLQSSSEKPKPP
ncbi:mucin-5AC-like isoform X2 [Homarus americanus]|uniref:mucin-5AC-like isoform X2 n=2 Tax=Homarus americanus TaxID=6706 RepID=UPI001C44FBD3|nr:mucin-5AC-like isoform X2 [Homarus americanus]